MSLSVSFHESQPLIAKKAFTVSSRGNKEWAADGFKKFSEWSKTEFYPADDSDDEDEDEDSGEKPSLPEVLFDKDGFAKLPSRTDVPLKGQQELIRQIFYASYKAFTGSSKPVPWGVIAADPATYVDLDCVPKDFVFRDPSHMRLVDVNKLWRHWELRRSANEKVIDLSKRLLANAVPLERTKKKKMYVEIDDETECPAKDSRAAASPRPTMRRGRPAGDLSSDWPASPRPTKRMKRPAEDSSDDEAAPKSCLRGPADRPSLAQHGAPAAVPMKDRWRFLRDLSSNDDYRHLVEGIRDLKKDKPSGHPEGWPAWATWSWERSYLPDTLHASDDELHKFLQ
ncbi:hypothetical protein CY34DRAFT_111310, partial [Suillus luteus UH-Slu-Lm8-n1]